MVPIDGFLCDGSSNGYNKEHALYSADPGIVKPRGGSENEETRAAALTG